MECVHTHTHTHTHTRTWKVLFVALTLTGKTGGGEEGGPNIGILTMPNPPLQPCTLSHTHTHTHRCAQMRVPGTHHVRVTPVYRGQMTCIDVRDRPLTVSWLLS